MWRWLPSLAAALLSTEVAFAQAEPLPRKESNVSIRNEVQLAIDKGLAFLAKTQREDGTWAEQSATAPALLAFKGDPRGRIRTEQFGPLTQKGFVALKAQYTRLLANHVEPRNEWNDACVLLALVRFDDKTILKKRAERRVNDLQVEALMMAAKVWPAKSVGPFPEKPTGSTAAAWILATLNSGSSHPDLEPGIAWLSKHYTLEENPGGTGIHRYYFFLSAALLALDTPGLLLADGRTLDIVRQLAEKLINGQNGDGSWSGQSGVPPETDDGRVEADRFQVTALSLLTLEAIYSLL